jgi:pantetheine-phosphate adenylyltransferase
MNIAIFPGSFDPLTKAHVNILNRALPLFDKVIVGIGKNSTKQSLLSIEKRKLIIEKVYEHEKKIEVRSYDTLTVNFCLAVGAKYMIRGIRTVSDFEYEKGIAQMNHALAPDIESIFIISKPGYSAISSTIVRDILRYGGDVSQFVPQEAIQFI